MILKKIISKQSKKNLELDYKSNGNDNEAPYLEEEIIKIIQCKDENYKTSKKNPEQEFKYLIILIKKNPRARSNKEILTISRFLDQTEIIQKFKSNQENGLEFIKNMLKFTSTYIMYEFIEKDKILFNEGDVGNKFYIILKGSVKIIKYKEYEESLTLLGYFNHLENLKKDADLINIKYTMKANRDNIPVFLDIKNLDDISKIREKLELKRLIESTNDAIDLKKLIQDYNNKNKENNIALSKLVVDFSISQKNLSLTQLNMIRQHCIRSIKEFKNIDDNNKPIKLTLFEKHTYSTIKTGNYFGDLALEKKDQLRTATIQAEVDTYLGYLDYKIYNEFILKNKRGAELKEAEYLVNKFFFNFIDKCEFLESYFHYFFFMEKNKGDIVFEAGEELKFVYLIQEGEIEYILNDSIIGLIKIIKKLCSEANYNYSVNKYEEDILRRFNREKSINNKKSFKIFTSSSEHVIGLDEFFFSIPKFFQGKVISNNLKYYAIPKEKIMKMFEKSINLNVLLESSMKQKLNILINRLIDIKNSNFDLFGVKINENSLRSPSLILPKIKLIENVHTNDEFKRRKSVIRNTGDIINKFEFMKDFKIDRQKIFSSKSRKIEPLLKVSQQVEIIKKTNIQFKNDLKFNIVINKFKNSKTESYKEENEKEGNKIEDLQKSKTLYSMVKKIDNENYIKNIKINKNSNLNQIVEKTSLLNNNFAS